MQSFYAELCSIILLIMEIPPEKKPLFYLVSIPVFLVGLILGVLIVSYVFFKTKDMLCLVSQPPKINTELTPAQVQRATSLDQNRTIFGKVTSAEASSFTLQFSIVNPLDTKNSTTTSVKVTFDEQKDEVIKLKQVPAASGASSVKETKGSFSDIKVGEQVLLKILDGKKWVYLTPSS